MNHRLFYGTLLATALLGLLVSPAGATVVYSNLGSPQEFDTQNGWVVDGGVVAGQQLAVAFTPGSTVQFTDATVAMGIIFSNLAGSPLDLSLAANSAGLPGAPITDLMLGSGQSIGPFLPGNLATFVCAASCPVLNGGTQYWLVAQIPNLDLDHFESQAAWNWIVNNDYNSGTNFAYNDTQFGTGWVYSDPSFLRPAFEIDGTPVPEPASLWLLCSGVAGVAATLRGGKRS